MTRANLPPGRCTGTRVAGVGTSVATSVGIQGLGHGSSRAGTGRAAELASEAARAEGASLPATDRGRRGRVPSQAVKDEWARRAGLRGGGVPDIRP